MWFDIEPSDISFTQVSPFRFENEAFINAPPERVFNIVTRGERQEEWFQDFVAYRWTSPEPHGVGSTRDVELKMLSVKERFLIWEPGKRLAFTFTAITLPLVRRMVEDLTFEPVGERTRFRWVAHYEPAPVMRVLHPIARGVFGKLFAASTDALAGYAGRNPRDP